MAVVETPTARKMDRQFSRGKNRGAGLGAPTGPPDAGDRFPRLAAMSRVCPPSMSRPPSAMRWPSESAHDPDCLRNLFSPRKSTWSKHALEAPYCQKEPGVRPLGPQGPPEPSRWRGT